MELMTIASSGDLILDIRQEDDTKTFSYRVDTTAVRRSSPYFDHLLGGPFSEAQTAREKHKLLHKKYADLADAPIEEIPHIEVMDIGQISKVTTIKNITADFLCLLHGLDLSQPNPPIPNIANLAIVADRFDSLDILSTYVKRKKLLQTVDAKSRVKNVPEERVRQKLLIGYLLDYGPWVTKNSKQLILAGSKQWAMSEHDSGEDSLWWDLPHGIEEELQLRRQMILETISSVPSYYLRLYTTSGERQCKLGYDSSLACDSYQLGEMVRFLNRMGVFQLQSLILDASNTSEYAGDIDQLIENLRKCPNYQIDGNHAHCGLRNRMVPILDWLQYWLDRDSGSPDLGLCLECFKNRREDYAWCEAKRPLLWRRSGTLSHTARPKHPAASGQCSHRQFQVREMFSATERDWA